MKNNQKFDIVAYKDMSAMDDHTLTSLVNHEREAYGYEGFGEYLFCSSSDCRRMQSVDEVYNVRDTDEDFVPLKELEKDGAKKPDCPECNSPSILVFDPEHFKPYLASLFRGAYGALLIDQDGEVQGSTFALPDKLHSFFKENMDYKESFDWETYRSRVSEALDIDANKDTDIISWNRVSIGHNFRGGGTFSKLVGKALDSRPEFDKLPAMGATRFDSALYPILNPIGFKNITTDEFGTVGVGIDQVGKFRKALNLPPEEFKRQFGAKKKEVLEWQKQLKKPKKEPKFYKGAEILDEFQATLNVTHNIQSSKEANETLAPFTIETLNEPDFNDPEKAKVLQELSNAFRYTFNNRSGKNKGFGQFLFYPSEGKPISPQEVFGAKKGEYIPLELMDSFDTSKYPLHPKTGEEALIWHHPEVVRENFKSKLHRNGHISIMRNQQTNEIIGFSFGYPTTVRKACEYEEWINPYGYSLAKDERYFRNFNIILEKLNKTLKSNHNNFNFSYSGETQLKPDSPIYVWNAMGTLPVVRGSGNMMKITDASFGLIPEELREKLLHIGETEYLSNAHRMFKESGAVEVPGALNDESRSLKENDIVMITSPLSGFIERFSLPKD